MRKINMPTFAMALSLLLTACGGVTEQTADYNIIPKPQQVTLEQGSGFHLTDKTVIVAASDNDSIQRYAGFLRDYIEQMTGRKLKITDNTDAEDAIVITRGYDNSNPEAYRLSVNADRITIDGATAAGAFYGVQTLRKSIPDKEESTVLFPAVTISDAPRFGYRGAHFDVSRHFFPTDSVKEFIDMLALHNINRLHWHLTDDQGWRVEMKSRPRLAEISSKRPNTVIGHNTGEYDSIPVEGFYTQEEIKDIVKYASDRNIVIIPEIDLPGHMVAALEAYPELGCTGGPYEVWRIWGVSEDLLCAGNDSTLAFIDDVLGEITELFPSELIHIGGDECPKIRWENCSKCQARIRELGLKTDNHSTAEQKLQSYVMEHASKFLADRGRRIIGWDEILEGGMSKDAVIMSWRGESGGIEGAKAGHDVIMTPNSYLYFDYYQDSDHSQEPLAIGGYLPIEKVYSYEPMPEALTPEEQAHIIGVQANLWTEYIPYFWQVQYMELPRMAALSEVQWSEGGNKDFVEFASRVPQLAAQYTANGWTYAPHIFNVNSSIVPDGHKAFTVNMSTVDNAPIHYTLDGSEPTEASPVYVDPVKVDHSAVIKAAAFRPTGKSRVWSDSIKFNLATGCPVQLLQEPSRQYRGNGPETLTDGRFGTTSYNTGAWLGFVGNDLEAVIDLGEPTNFSSVGFSYLALPVDWIFDPTGASVAVSNDGENWKNIASKEIPASPRNAEVIVSQNLDFQPTDARYVKLTVNSLKSIPDWHAGKGRPGFIFVDEISVN